MATLQKVKRFKLKQNIRRGDTVVVIAGDEKGKRGEVIEVQLSKQRAIVEGVNIVKKHVKATQDNEGGIQEMPAPINLSNLALADPKTGEPTRVGRKIEDGKSVRYSKKTGNIIPVMKYEARLKTKYKNEVVPALMEQFNYTSVMQVPIVQKICINQGIGDATGDKKLIDIAITELTTIVGQKAVSTKAKTSVSNFKLREGMPIGVRVTLRGERMYEFMDRFFNISLPRVRDFKGVSDKSFDGRGNFSMGITEQIIFPEIDIDKINKIMGMDITFVTNAPTDAEAYALLKAMGMPFVKR